MTFRRVGALTVIFCGLALGFSGLSFLALGRGASAALAATTGLVLIVIGITLLPRPVRPPVAGWTPGSKARGTEEPPSA
jgi:hypothetical protein